MAMTAAAVIGFGFLNAYLLRQDYAEFGRLNAAEMRQAQAAASQFQGPRLLLAGGSNVMFGLDAGLVGQRVGAPAVNVGMPGMLGSEANYLDFLLPLIRPGDVVVYSSSNWMVAPTAHQQMAARLNDGRLASVLGTLGALKARNVTTANWPVWTLFPERPLLKRLTSAETEYTLHSRDALGNARACVVDPRERNWLPLPSQPPDAMLGETRELARQLRARGATLVLAEAWTLVRAKDLGGWLAYRERLNQELSAIAPVLAAPANTVLRVDPQLFCDGPLHLSAEGRRVRSEYLAESLAAVPEVNRLRHH